jgi:hypothetical protein
MTTAKEQLVIKGDKEKSAVFSPCMRYRYCLTRVWNHIASEAGVVSFIGLNPSTADETVNDPTVARCIQYAKSWGMDGMMMLNLFAYRATDPKVMKTQEEPVGLSNDTFLESSVEHSAIVVAAWGTHGAHLERDRAVMKLLARFQIKCLGVTKDGHPKHPLYLRKNLTPMLFRTP